MPSELEVPFDLDADQFLAFEVRDEEQDSTALTRVATVMAREVLGIGA